jgi:hypothetical protein
MSLCAVHLAPGAFGALHGVRGENESLDAARADRAAVVLSMVRERLRMGVERWGERGKRPSRREAAPVELPGEGLTFEEASTAAAAAAVDLIGMDLPFVPKDCPWVADHPRFPPPAQANASAAELRGESTISAGQATRVTTCLRVESHPGRATWAPWLFPLSFGQVWIDNLSAVAQPERYARLGRDNTWLPVVHQANLGNSQSADQGLWFYHAEGCSDVEWNTGRTLAARNRVHAALVLARLSGHQGTCGELAAAPQESPQSQHDRPRGAVA